MPETFAAAQPLPPAMGVVDQRTWLVQRARGRGVLHLGCVDDRLTVERAGTGDLLHQELATAAQRLVGVDIAEEGIRLLRDLVPGEYIVGDVERLPDLDLPVVDLVIASELIEHLGSPADFLNGLRTYLARSGGTALVTTPNALSWRYWASAVTRRQEMTHPDHRLLYSPLTLTRAIDLAGLAIVGLWSHTWRDRRSGLRQRSLDAIDRVALRRSPWLGVGLIAEVSASTT